MNKLHSNVERRTSQLPGWLWPNSNILPQLYQQIWDAVRDDRARPGTLQREVLVDTNKIFPLLLTSQLPTEILGYIWSIANQKYAGQLTEQELYIVLALVALAQASYPFNSLEVLHFIRVPPIPTLNVSLLSPPFTQTKIHSSPFESLGSNLATQERKYTHQSSAGIRTNHSTLLNEEKSLHDYTHPGDVKIITNSGRHNVSNLDTKSNNHFQQDFKTQACGSTMDSGDEFSDFQSAPIPCVPSIAILDSKQGSAIGSRLANHNLGVKKISEKTRKSNIVKSQHSSSQQRFCINANAMIHGKDVQGGERLSELFPKCTLKSQAKTVILKDTVIRSEPSKAIDTAPRDFNVVDKLESNEFGNFVRAEPLSNKIVVPKNVANSQQDLMSLQPAEDKYSALRALVEEAPASPLPPTKSLVNKPIVTIALIDDKPPPIDDFGDFVSAEQPREPTPEPDPLNVDLLTDFDFNHYRENDGKSDPSLLQEISNAFNALGIEGTAGRRMSEEKFDIVYEPDKIAPKEDTLSVNSIDIGSGIPGNLPRSASVPSLDLKSFLPSSQEDDQSPENVHQIIYSEWKQYMESCVLLLQVAANIFTSITSDAVLREVLSSAHGYNFLCNLAEVAAVCRRVNFSHKEMDINVMGFDDLLLDIDRIWAEMEPFYANIPIVTELPVWSLHQGDNVTCALCLTVITSGRVVHNESNYHVTCANLWLNCVNSNLPALRNPSGH